MSPVLPLFSVCFGVFVVCFSSGFPPSTSFRNLPRYTSRTGHIVSSLRAVLIRRLRLSIPREVATHISDTLSRPCLFPQRLLGSLRAVRDCPPRFFQESRRKIGPFSWHGHEVPGLVLGELPRLFASGREGCCRPSLNRILYRIQAFSASGRVPQAFRLLQTSFEKPAP